jgi:putative aldouronate transport system substrate-binding protein
MRKVTLFTLSLLVLFSLVVSACGSPAATATSAPAETEEQQAPEATAEATEEPSAARIPIRIFAPQDPNRDMETNVFSNHLEEMFNVDFEWTTTTYDGNSAKELRQVTLASGDLPDVFMLIPWVDQFTQVELLKYGEEGVIVPLNDLIEQHAPNIQAALEKYPDFKSMTVAPDGTIWGLPQLIQCYHCSYANKMWINRKWLEALNLEMPKTTEEFKAMLEAFKTQDPNGNGVADEIPLSGAIMDYGTRPIPFLMNGFTYNDDRTYLILNDGKVDTVANKEGWKEGLAYIKSLYDAGLIDPGAFTNNADAYLALGDNADAQLLGAGAGMHPAIFVTTFTENPPYAWDYDPLPPLQGPNAQYATYIPNMVPGATFVITNQASPEAQEALIKIVDYMFTFEGHMHGIFGLEGENWRKPEPGDVAVNRSAEALYATIPDGPANNSWGPGAQYFDPIEIRDGWVQAEDIYTAAGYERRLQEATDLYAGKESPDLFPFWAVWPDPAVADEQALLKQNITDYINQNALAFVTGEKDLEADWDAYVQGLEDLNLARYLEINQAAYDTLKQ